ncbi:hypothetical protein [Leptospira sp. GIMC2001]|uniref:hypothetical protein n=1 Tax=Leptospira sp. GIMC2001 TaxID=1513297 RepID=UPI00234B3FA3|nr:hypothetical protein [Leptospira sp. GIMC2001]WCL48592.1 hypothetical protein O4O04_14955 [Leptospira sp. GIMC2001]
MKKSIILLAVFLIHIQCSTFANYIENRALDTADILTLSVEKKVVGVNAKFCIVSWGLQSAEYGQGYGLRSGSFGAYRTGSKKDFYNSGNSYLFLNSVQHYPEKNHVRNNKIKAFNHSNSFGLVIFDWDGYNFVTQCEVSLGLYYGFRFGFNIAEFADWLVGWTTLDFLDDDLN